MMKFLHSLKQHIMGGRPEKEGLLRITTEPVVSLEPIAEGLAPLALSEYEVEYDADPEIHIDVKSPYFYILQSHVNCWRCKLPTTVYGLLIPCDSLIKEPYERDEKGFCVWQHPWQCQVLSFVTYLSKPSLDAITKITERYWFDTRDRKGTDGTIHYYMNHCPHCKAKVRDAYLTSRYNAPFNPATWEEASPFLIERIDLYLEACVDAGPQYGTTNDILDNWVCRYEQLRQQV